MKDKLFYYKAKCINVVDGDTIDAVVDYGFCGKLTLRFRIYQEGDFYFDTPEAKLYRGVNEEHKQHGLEAKKRAEELLLNKDIYLKSYKEGSFRWLGEIWLEDGTNYVELMVSEGFQKKEQY